MEANIVVIMISFKKNWFELDTQQNQNGKLS